MQSMGQRIHSLLDKRCDWKKTQHNTMTCSEEELSSAFSFKFKGCFKAFLYAEVITFMSQDWFISIDLHTICIHVLSLFSQEHWCFLRLAFKGQTFKVCNSAPQGQDLCKQLCLAWRPETSGYCHNQMPGSCVPAPRRRWTHWGALIHGKLEKCSLTLGHTIHRCETSVTKNPS